jgi:hypothetical protein
LANHRKAIEASTTIGPADAIEYRGERSRAVRRLAAAGRVTGRDLPL